MDSAASLSFPSEPADIGNWFSNYTYESPELNSIEDFKLCGESRKIECGSNKIEEEEDLGGNEALRETGCLVASVKEASSDTLQSEKCIEDNKCHRKDTGSSDELSLCSEPPDIKNWFSSYVYESPALESAVEFKNSFVDDIDSSEANDTVKYTEEIEVHVIKSSEAGKIELACQQATPAGLVRCIQSAQENKSDGQHVFKKEYDGILDSIGNLEKLRGDCENRQAKGSKLQNETSDGSLKTTTSGVASPRFWEMNSGHTGRKSSARSTTITENLHAQHPPKDATRGPPRGSLEFRNTKTCQLSEEAPDGNNEKENCENGYISTRKHKHRLERDGNSCQRSLCPSRLSADTSTAKQDAAPARRKVLSDSSNIQHSTAVGILGKWKCPQKDKPYLGPPLKQLRLEKWVHRV